MKRLILLAAAFAAFAGPALAAPVVLRAEVADADGRVTLGDIFEGAGSAGSVLIANRAGPTVVLDAAAVQLAARRAGLQWDNPTGLRRIIVRAGVSDTPATAAAPRGNVEVLTYARSITAGEIVQPQDLIWAKMAAAPADAPNDAEAVIGLVARRPLRAGAAVALRDVSQPQVIKAGDLVNVTWSGDGITLTLQAKAMTAAAVGQPFQVQNLSSKKVIEAVASGPGAAVTGQAAEQLKAASRNPALYAAR